eukprot:s1159_g13.t1
MHLNSFDIKISPDGTLLETQTCRIPVDMFSWRAFAKESERKDETLGSELLQLCFWAYHKRSRETYHPTLSLKLFGATSRSHFRLHGPTDCDAETESAALLRRRKDACETSRAWLLLAAQRMEMHILQAQREGVLPTVVAEQYAQLLVEVDGKPYSGFAASEQLVSQVAGAKAARQGASKRSKRHERDADDLILQAILEIRSGLAVDDWKESLEAVSSDTNALELLEEVKQAKEAFRQRSHPQSHEHAFLSAMLDAAEAQNFQCPVCLNEFPPTERVFAAPESDLIRRKHFLPWIDLEMFTSHHGAFAQRRVLAAARLLAVVAVAAWWSGLGTRLAWICAGEGRSRRNILSAGLLSWSLPELALAEETAKSPTELQLRFNGTEVEKLPSGFIPGWGPDDLYYPSWMEGRWRVEQTLQGYAAPLGKPYLANGQSAVAEKVLAEQQSQLGKPVTFELRYIRTQRNNIVEDRAFNTRAKLNAFAGRDVVKSVEYVDVPDNTRESATQGGNGPEDPLRTVVVNFKGAVQKIFITALQFETAADGNVWRGLASTRTLFAAPGAGYNPLTVDEEVVTALKRSAGTVTGRLRLLGFLNPNDQLFFKAGNRAVSIADYSLKFFPIKDSD